MYVHFIPEVIYKGCEYNCFIFSEFAAKYQTVTAQQPENQKYQTHDTWFISHAIKYFLTIIQSDSKLS